MGIVDEIKELKELLDSNVINQNEFDQFKKILINTGDDSSIEVDKEVDDSSSVDPINNEEEFTVKLAAEINERRKLELDQKNNDAWTFSIIMGVAMIVSFFLPWFGIGGNVSYGSNSFNSYISATPLDAYQIYYPYMILSMLSLIFAVKRWWFSIIPALFNLFYALSYEALYGKGFSGSFSANGVTVNSSTGLTYGFYIFLFSIILFSLATIYEPIKFLIKISKKSKN